MQDSTMMTAPPSTMTLALPAQQPEQQQEQQAAPSVAAEAVPVSPPADAAMVSPTPAAGEGKAAEEEQKKREEPEEEAPFLDAKGEPIKENTGRWTLEEHNMFLQGLEDHGKGWKKIASLIKTRTVVQIRTHAQKYFQKLAKAKAQGENVPVHMDVRTSASNPPRKVTRNKKQQQQAKRKASSMSSSHSGVCGGTPMQCASSSPSTSSRRGSSKSSKAGSKSSKAGSKSKSSRRRNSGSARARSAAAQQQLALQQQQQHQQQLLLQQQQQQLLLQQQQQQHHPSVMVPPVRPMYMPGTAVTDSNGMLKFLSPLVMDPITASAIAPPEGSPTSVVSDLSFQRFVSAGEHTHPESAANLFPSVPIDASMDIGLDSQIDYDSLLSKSDALDWLDQHSGSSGESDDDCASQLFLPTASAVGGGGVGTRQMSPTMFEQPAQPISFLNAWSQVAAHTASPSVDLSNSKDDVSVQTCNKRRRVGDCGAMQSVDVEPLFDGVLDEDAFVSALLFGH